MKKIFACLFAAFMLCGCSHLAVHHNKMVMADGRQGHSVMCAQADDMYCKQRMGEECPAGYEVVDVQTTSHAIANRFMATTGGTYTYYFVCR